MATQAIARASSSVTALSKPSTPVTPVAQTPSAPTPQTVDSPGTWRHPRLEEITRRKNAAIFTSTDLQKVTLNSVLLFVTLLSPPSLLQPLINFLTSILASIPPNDIPWEQYGALGLRLLFLTNILMALRPLYAKQDECTDVPLTPSQRKLLGLDPAKGSPAPPTPGSGYITPPRYARSPSGTPQSCSSRRAIAGSSPLSAASWRSSSHTPFGSPYFANGSPSGGQRDSSGSPLLRNTLTGSGNGTSSRRRWSHGSMHSPLALGRSGSDGLLGMSFGDSTSSVPQTPSPSGNMGRGLSGKSGASVQLNSKWLYEKGRVSLGGSRGIY